MAETKFQICSRALRLIGLPGISSFDEGNKRSDVARDLYDQAAEALLTSSRFRWATTQADLVRSPTVPKARWDAAYSLPADPAPIRIWALTLADNPVEYDRYESLLYCDLGPDDVPTLDYTFRVGESLFPPEFRMALVYELAVQFAGAITRNGQLAGAYLEKAGEWLAKAKTADAQSVTSRRVVANRFTRTRR